MRSLLAAVTASCFILLVVVMSAGASTPATVCVSPGCIKTADLANGAVTGIKIAAGAITNANISATAGIAGSKLAAASISSAQLAPGAVTAAKIAAGAVTNTSIGAGAAIAGSKLAAGAALSNLASGSVTNAKLAGNSVGGSNVVNGSLTGDDLASTLALGTLGTTGLFTAGAGATVSGGNLHLAGDVSHLTAAPASGHEPLGTPGPGAGSTGTCGTTSGSSDTRGTLTVTAGGGDELYGTVVCTITFRTAFATAPYVVFTSADNATAYFTQFVFVTESPQAFELQIRDDDTLFDGDYNWNYVVVG
jgi:hypothetical protein